MNFLIRLRILLADPKLDMATSSLAHRIDSLLTSIASEWQHCHIQGVYFEKIVSMCRDYNHEVDSMQDDKVQAKKPTAKSKTSAKSKSSASSQGATGSKADDGRQLSASLLSACLDIFAILAHFAPKNSFLMDDSSQLNDIFSSCFNFARKPEEIELRSKLKKFVVHFLSRDRGTRRMDLMVVQKLKVLLEKYILESENEYKNIPDVNSSSDESSRHGNSRPRSASTDNDNYHDCTIFFAVEIVRDVNATKPSFFKSFASVLLGLLSTIVRRHTTSASTKQKQGGVSFVPQAGTSTIRQMYHTPIAGILAECSTENTSAVSAGGRASQPKDSFPSKNLKEFDLGLRAAVMILDILGGSGIAHSFTLLRKTFLQNLTTILDSSNNVQLLIASVRVVARWLSEASGGPLTLKERNSFLWKIASFDFNGMPDVVSQPLADLVSRFVVLMLEGRRENLRFEIAPKKFNATPQKIGDSDEMLIGRSLVACLLTANNSLREVLLSHFVSRVAVGKDQSRKAAFEMEGIPRHAPVELVWQLFHSDLEGLGGRNWVVLFVEVLLSSTYMMPSHTTTLRRLPSPVASATDSKFTDSVFHFFSSSMMAVEEDMASGGRQFRTSISRLAHGDPSFAQALFQTLFPEAWVSVKSDNIRFNLIAPIESLLSRSYHSQFLKSGRAEDSPSPQNGIRAFLNGLVLLSPMPVLDIDLLVSLAETYNCWYEVLSMLEDQFAIFSCKTVSASGQALRDKILLAIRHCYDQLGESNVLTSLALTSCNLSQIHRAVSLAVHGEIEKALEEYTSLLELVESSENVLATELEVKLSEERWIDLNRELCQTSVVSEYANTANIPHLMLESAWKQREWDRVRTLCSAPVLVAAVEFGDATVKMCETLLAVADGKLNDVENLHAQTAQLCLYKWQLLPKLSHASLAHASLLHFFHRLVEIRESGQIMVETSNHSTGKTLPDLKNLLK